MTHLFGSSAAVLLGAGLGAWYWLGWKGAFVGAIVGVCWLIAACLLWGTSPPKEN